MREPVACGEIFGDIAEGQAAVYGRLGDACASEYFGAVSALSQSLRPVLVAAQIAAIVLPGGGVGFATKSAAKVEQYALRANESGFYPVLRRGFKEAQELVWLNKGDVWKFGTTKNPASRYSQRVLDSIGQYGVKYSREFQGSKNEALVLENMKILNFLYQHGFLPAGNKIIR
jgi:hypothetical protein